MEARVLCSVARGLNETNFVIKIFCHRNWKLENSSYDENRKQYETYHNYISYV